MEYNPVTFYDEIYDQGPGSSLDTFQFYAMAGEVFEFRMNSHEIDPWLSINDGFTTWATDGGYGPGNEAYINFVAPFEGWFMIDAGSPAWDQGGTYWLSVNDPDHEWAVFPGSGMELYNEPGGKGVTVSTTKDNREPHYHDNSNMGVKIMSEGTVSVTGARGDNNVRTGLSIETLKNVTVQDKDKYPHAEFNNNGWDGMFVETLGSIKLYGVGANNNGWMGANLDNCWEYEFEPEVLYCEGKNHISVGTKKNMNVFFGDNFISGVNALSGGNITLVNVDASNNGGDGAFLRNRFYNRSGSITVKRSGDVWNTFNNNGWLGDECPEDVSGCIWNGLSAISRGTIKASYIDAHGNGPLGFGIYLDNYRAEKAKHITLTNGNADENDATGIYIRSLGNITVQNIAALRNKDTGVFLKNDYEGFSGNVTVKYSSGYMNEMAENNGKGLEIQSNGTVKAGNLEIRDNFLTDGHLDWFESGAVHEYFNADAGPDRWWFYHDGSPDTITLDVSQNPDFNWTGFVPEISLYQEDPGNPPIYWTSDIGDTNFGSGDTAYISFGGPAGMYFVEVNSLGGDGFYQLNLNNPSWSDMDWIWTSGASINAGKTVSISGKEASNFHHNSLAGLGAYAPGNVTVKWAYGSANGAEGILLSSDYGTINLSGKSSSYCTWVSGNGWSGIQANTDGKVSLTNVRSYNNNWHGVSLGWNTPISGSVTLNGVEADNNAGTGIYVDTMGQITAKKISGSFNGESGALLMNWDHGPTYPVKLIGDSFFHGNGEDGLVALSDGYITISKVYADGNNFSGVAALTDESYVTMSKVVSNNNGASGIYIEANLGLSLNNVVTMSNGFGIGNGNGLRYTIYDPFGYATIRYSVFMGNEGSGIDAYIVYPTLIKTYYFGNDWNGDGDPNIDFTLTP